MYQYLNDKQKKQFFGAVVGVLGLLAIFILIQAVSGIKQFSYIGRGINPTNVITVTGTGSVLAVPDTAEFSFSVVSDAKQATDAQNTAATKTNAIIAALKAMNIAEADIQTTGYNSYPTYTYQNAICPQPVYNGGGTVSPMDSGAVGSAGSGAAIYCPPGKQTLTGYEVSETIDVKVRNTAAAGAALSKVGTLGATNISGLSFVVDNPDAAQTQARDEAIADAKAKAAHLSQVLGVKLNHIVNFEDNSSQPFYAPMPMNATASSAGSVTPQVEAGQNKITDNVTISYEVD
jgi:uncharacterized protein YggE